MKDNGTINPPSEYGMIVIRNSPDLSKWLEDEQKRAKDDLRGFCREKLVELISTGGIKRNEEICIKMPISDQLEVIRLLLSLVDTK